MAISTNSSAGAPVSIAAPDPIASQTGNANSPAKMRDQPDLRHRILTAVFEATKPAELQPPWGILRSTTTVRRLRCSPAELADLLRERFSVEQLLEVGVFTQDGSELPALTATLAAPSALMFITKDNMLEDIHSARGALIANDMPSVRYAKMRADSGKHAPIPLLLAADDADVSVLHALKIRTDWAAGLDEVCGRDVRRMFRRDKLGCLSAKYRLTLVGWQVAALDLRPPAAILKILEKLSHVAQLYGFDPATLFEVWLPNPLILRETKRAIPFKDEKLMRRIYARSLVSCVHSFSDARFALAKPKELDYGAAERHLMNILEDCRNMHRPDAVRAALERLNLAFDKDLLRPLQKSASAATDPVERLLLYQAVALAEIFYQTRPVLAAARRAIALEPSQMSTLMSSDDIENLCKLIDKLLKIYRELDLRKR